MGNVKSIGRARSRRKRKKFQDAALSYLDANGFEGFLIGKQVLKPLERFTVEEADSLIAHRTRELARWEDVRGSGLRSERWYRQRERRLEALRSWYSEKFGDEAPPRR